MASLRSLTALTAILFLTAPQLAHAKGETLLWLVQDADKGAMVTAKQAIDSQLVDLEVTLRTVIVPVLATQEAGQKQQARSAAGAIKTATAVAWWRNARTEVVVYVPSTDQIRTRTLEAPEGADRPSPEMATEALALILRATVESARAEEKAQLDATRALDSATNTETKAMGIAGALSATQAAPSAPVTPNSGPGLAETTTPPPEPAPAPEPPPLEPEPVVPPPPAAPAPTPASLSIGLGHEITFDANEALPQFASLRVEYALTPGLVFGAAYGYGIPESLDFDSVELRFARHRGDFTAGYRFVRTDRFMVGGRTGISIQHTAHETRYLSTGASGAGEGYLLQVGFPAELTIAVALTDSVVLGLAGGAYFWLQSPTYAVTQGTRSVDVHTPDALRPTASVSLVFAL